MKLGFHLNKLSTGLLVFSVPLFCLLWNIPIHLVANTSVADAFQISYAVFGRLDVQWMQFFSSIIYFVIIVLLSFRHCPASTEASESILCLAFVLGADCFWYAFDYPAAAQSTQALMLITGMLLGKGLRAWLFWQSESYPIQFKISCVTIWLVLMQALDSQPSPTDAKSAGLFSFVYQHDNRWVGSWGNPNTYGLLMGMGLALAVGQFATTFILKIPSQAVQISIKKYLRAGVFFLAATLIARGLLHSYSRGAWLGTICGLVYLFWSNVQSLRSETHSRLIFWWAKNSLLVAIILVSTFLLAFWHFRQVDWNPARRAFSTANAVDFSWRNRVAAWEGAMQMMVERPWFGSGWNRLEPLYKHYYLPPKLNESAAIEMNDYFVLGATLGIPALFCFGMYLGLSLTKKLESGNLKREIMELGWLKMVCRAGAIVLLVGFWFDGGLFNLPTAVAFWVLLELGAVQSLNRSEPQTNEAP